MSDECVQGCTNPDHGHRVPLIRVPISDGIPCPVWSDGQHFYEYRARRTGEFKDVLSGLFGSMGMGTIRDVKMCECGHTVERTPEAAAARDERK